MGSKGDNVTYEEIMSSPFYRKVTEFVKDFENSKKTVKSQKAAVSKISEFYKTFYERGFERLDLAVLDSSNILNKVCWDLLEFIATKDCNSEEANSLVLIIVWLRVSFSKRVDSDNSKLLLPRAVSLLIRKLVLLAENQHNNNLVETSLECRIILRLLIEWFQNFEFESLRKSCLSLVSPLIWYHLPNSFRKFKLFGKYEIWSNLYNKTINSNGNLCNKIKEPVYFLSILEGKNYFELEKIVIERDFIHVLIKVFIYLLDLVKLEDDLDTMIVTDEFQSKLLLLETILEFFNDLTSQLVTRRMVKPLLDANFFLILCKNSRIYSHLQGTFFKKLTDILEFYLSFSINDYTGLVIDYETQMNEYYKRFEQFQKIAFNDFRDIDLLENMHLESINTFTDKKMSELFDKLKLKVLLELASKLEIVYMDDLAQNSSVDSQEFKSSLDKILPYKLDVKRTNKEIKGFITFLLAAYLSKPLDPSSRILDDPVYPNEDYLWNNASILTSDHYVNYLSLPLPKLTLQYLSIYDYLYRNYHLYRLESSYQIKSDLEEVIYRMKPVCSLGLSGKFTSEQLLGYRDAQNVSNTRFTASSRMGIKLDNVVITNVYKPQVGVDALPRVTADLYIDLSELTDFTFRDDWDSLRRFDVLFLASIAAPLEFTDKRLDELKSEDIPLCLGIMGLRGAEIISIVDENGTIFTDSNPYEPKIPCGTKRCISVYLDYAQYQLDLKEDIEGIYSNCNLLLRRHARFNNFKSTLDAIRSLVNSSSLVAPWFESFFLGYGEFDSLKYFSVYQSPTLSLDWLNVIKDLSHLVESFPNSLYYQFSDEPDLKRLVFKGTRLVFKGVTGVKENFSIINGGNAGDYVNLVVHNILTFINSNEESRGFQSKLLPKDLKEDNVTIKKKLNFKLGINAVSVKMNGVVFSVNNKIYTAVWRADIESNYNVVDGNYYTKHELYPGSRYPLKGIHLSESPNISSKQSQLGIRLTDRQIEAIYSSVQYGLTCIVGPPGTGKTDVVAQVVNILYSNCPNEKIVVVAHSNQCLNDIFEKILEGKVVDQRYIVRLGMGERKLDLQCSEDFGKWGRVNYMLQSRLDLLDEVAKLGNRLRVDGDVGFSVQLALQFFENHIIHKIMNYKGLLDSSVEFENIGVDMQLDCCLYNRRALEGLGIDSEVVGVCEYMFVKALDIKFQTDDPLHEWNNQLQKYKDDNRVGSQALSLSNSFKDIFKFVNIAEQAVVYPLHALTLLKLPKHLVYNPFDRDNLNKIENLLEIAPKLDLGLNSPPLVACYPVTDVLSTFHKIKECLPFEVLRSNTDRGHYLIAKHAKIIAMTCTHAAIARERLIESNFCYDTLIMEEAAQVLEIETFIPLTLQKNADRLKRIVLVGDHRQLPPIVQNRTVAKYSKLDQSLFNRLIRLQHPRILLNKQGRSRPEIVSLYSHYYLEEIQHVGLDREEFTKPNLGLKYNYQFIDVNSGSGESCPISHFYQNLEEAEYVVALYMYMRKIGYDSKRISILTTYNGQKALIEDVIKHKCAWNPKIGSCTVSTVDKFQGQQNDYIIISLVRTRRPGHIKDHKRLIVALSRARLGLYIFGKWDLFYNCNDIRDTFDKLSFARKLVLLDDKGVEVVVNDYQHLQKIVREMQ